MNSVFPGEQAKGVTDAGSAAVRVSGMEVGGLFGSLLAGGTRLCDTVLRTACVVMTAPPNSPTRVFRESASRFPAAVH